MNNKQTVIVRGTLHWAKILGNARPHSGNSKYDKGPSWSVDFTPNPAGRKTLVDLGLKSKFRLPRENDDRTESFLTLRILENRANGEKNDPPKVLNARGEVWDGGLIGNGTEADVKLNIVDYGPGSEKGLYLQALRIGIHVPYVGTDFPPLEEDDEFSQTTSDEDWS